MTNYHVAKLIPANFRAQLLRDNIIYKAVVAPGDPHMTILVIIYQNYIFNEGEPVDMSNPCLKCIDKVLSIFKDLLPELITLEKESKLLEAL